MISKVLALTAFEIVRHWFGQSAEAEHKCLRIKNFTHEETIAFLDVWDSKSSEHDLQGITVVVANTEKAGILEKYLADTDKSITWYRNNNVGGLVYLETKVQSDEQGLQNFFTLTDSNFLDNSFNDPNGQGIGDVRRLIVDKAWEVSGGEISRKPRLLIDRVVEIVSLLHPRRPVPVRRFVTFALGVCNEWINHDQAQSEEQINALVGRNLVHLECFPDETWRVDGDSKRTERLLYQNAMHADHVNGSADMDGAQLALRVQRFPFHDETGAFFEGAELESWRQACVEFLITRSSEVRSKIPYYIFLQIFELPSGDITGLKLGDRISQEIESSNPNRMNELMSLNVIDGLNVRLQEDAQRFLDAESPQGEISPLADLISKKTRKLVENLARPPSRSFFDPMQRLVLLVRRHLDNFENDSKATYVTISLAPQANKRNCSIGLFAFLFGSTLKEICENSRDIPGGLELRVADPVLLAPGFPPPFQIDVEEEIQDDSEQEDQDEGGRNGLMWDGVPLQFAFFSADGNQLESFLGEEWLPDHLNYFALMWLLIAAQDSPSSRNIGALRLPVESPFDEWLQQCVFRAISLESLLPCGPAASKGSHPVIDGLLASRLDFFTRSTASGLSIEIINDYIDSWIPLLEQIRNDFVPRGRRENIPDAFLSNDHIILEDEDHRLMCPYHPIRLRWLAHYLRQGQQISLAALAIDSAMNMYDPEYYLGWLAKLSPNDSPPITIGNQGAILFSKNENGWFEEFSTLENSAPSISMDSKSVDCISRQIVAYLESHPYKKDGLSILIILPPTDMFPSELVTSFRKAEWKDTRVKVAVAVPIERWEGVARAFEGLPSVDRHLSTQALFPPNDLSFIEFKKEDSLEEKLQSEKFDIAVVTNILQESVTLQQNTEPPVQRSGVFDPLLDLSSRLDGGENGGAISIVMRPRNPDIILESWSTLVVRSNRTTPVSSSQEENTDFVELRINFDNSSRLFTSLHRCSHWVITLERHISRRQIESIEAAPDILSIEEGVGANGLSTLVVSSSTGRQFIVSRLERKLQKLIPAEQLSQRSLGYANLLATRAYDETRRMAPRLALRAMGISRVTEEIIGIAVARNIASQLCCPPVSNGVSAWISLDEHTDWFGGAGSTRADLLWVSISAGEVPVVNIVVVEGKLRQVFDAHGVQQVKATMDFVEGVLAKPGEGEERVDAKLWREKILSAIELASPDCLEDALPNSSTVSPGNRLPLDIREKFRSGHYKIGLVRGLYSICLWNNAPQDIKMSSTDRVDIVLSSQKDILALVENELPTALVPGHPEVIKGKAQDDQKSQTVTNIPVDTQPAAIPKIQDSDQSTDVAVSGDAVPKGASVHRSKMNSSILKSMYQQIMDCFASYQVQVKTTPPDEEPYVEGPASVLFKVLPASGVDPRKLMEKSQALKLELRLDSEQEIAFGIDKGYVTIDVPKAPEHRYYVDAADLWANWERPQVGLSVPLGEDRFGNPVVIEFSSSNSPHLLIGGTTGSGKSEALNAILYGLVKHYSPSELRLKLIDPKGTELISFEDAPHLDQPIGWDDQDAISILQQAVAEMQRRYELFKQGRKRILSEYNSSVPDSEKLPWIVIVLDEYADLTSDRDAKREIEQELKRLAQKARASGIHVIIATQKPSGEVISTDLRSNLPAQLALRVRSGTESRVIMEESGAEMLNGKGDGFLRRAGRLERVQCALVKLEDQAF